ncbi:MAG: bifunctional 4-hydroxy-2-oxoglutarate aldolase/2-dehydro-3-deoxy-phosphogluconate aldolase [Planctomycetales bacterium]|nr:bifunctional 4-hydroxy-2-oxoglutarate aldolase/2-dehydro-3-deoxy-phosphogluconate aldolase [Planctomycetales bacterium]MCA9170793.1 bifunctional 4-hydroxy-2-oxoglutarate aldolase/2-dehydro-3-deoxy-phosphogluconate aldolase [Planctomycetales bacterium]
MPTFSPEMVTRVETTGVIAVLVIDDADQAVPVARALLAGGVDAMELTLRTPAALEALRRIRAEVPEMLAGIGTILTVQQVDEVVAAGAAFGVSPGTNPRVINAARQQQLPFAPGIVTPSDIEQALELDCRLLKFFPAEPSGGLSYLRSIAAPFAHLGVRYVPLGGVNTENLTAYLSEPAVLAVGGSWLAPRDLIQAQNWGEIERRASDAKRQAIAVRG